MALIPNCLISPAQGIEYITSPPVDCGPPAVPWNGSLEIYTSTSDGSVVFYSCDPGLVPEERMVSVCTVNGWSPNPGVLRCSVGMLVCQVPAQ